MESLPAEQLAIIFDRLRHEDATYDSLVRRRLDAERRGRYVMPTRMRRPTTMNTSWVICRMVCRRWNEILLRLRRAVVLYEARLPFGHYDVWLGRAGYAGYWSATPGFTFPLLHLEEAPEPPAGGSGMEDCGEEDSEIIAREEPLLRAPFEFSSLVVARGWLPVVQWALDQGCPFPESTYSWAAFQGNLPMLQWLHGHAPAGLRPEQLGAWAAESGQLAVLQWAANAGCKVADWASAFRAARSGRLDILQWIVSQGFGVQPEVLRHAARSGNLEMVQWLCTHLQLNAALFDKFRIAQAAAKSGNLTLLEWLHSQGARCARIIDAAAVGGNVEMLEWIVTNLGQTNKPSASTMERAVVKGHMAVLEWLRSRGQSLKDIQHEAARYGQMGVFQWAISCEGGIPMDEEVCRIAAEMGRLDILRMALASGIPLSEGLAEEAARGGRLVALKWLFDNGCPMSELTCAAAAECGDVRIIRWLRFRGCAWDERTTIAAARQGWLDVLRWAIDNGCPVGEAAWTAAVTSRVRNRLTRRHQVLKWACENGHLTKERLMQFEADNEGYL